MIEFRACQPAHIKNIVPQPDQAFEYEGGVNNAENVVHNSIAMSAWDSWRCVAAAGVMTVWPGRALAWALLSEYAKDHMWSITRRCLFILNSHPAARIEMTIRGDFEPAHRWASLMGFVCETPGGMKHFYTDGMPGYLYSRVK